MCFSSTPVPPTAAKIVVLSNLDSVGWDYSGSRSPCQASKFVGVPGGEGWYPTGGGCVPHWGTVRTPLGDGAYPSGGRCIPHWGTVRTPLGDGAYPTGGRCVPHRGAVRTPLGDGAYPTGGRCVPHWGTVCTPLGDGGYPCRYRADVAPANDAPAHCCLQARARRPRSQGAQRTFSACRNPSTVDLRPGTRSSAVRYATAASAARPAASSSSPRSS
jgi:hypothetical protein